MTRSLYFVFGIVAYLVFLLTFLYLVGFIADLSWLPHTVDRPSAGLPPAVSAAVDFALIALFGLQHSGMARQRFKRGWTRIVPPAIERSVYVLTASLMLLVLFALWRPLPVTVWRLNGAPAAALWMLFGMGWAVVLASTFLINHFELFGLQQVWNGLRARAMTIPRFRTPFFYRLVRHPLYSGFFLAFWATPHMTAGHLLLAFGMSVYMLVAIEHEERDLIGLFGEEYETYRGEVGKLVPRLRRS